MYDYAYYFYYYAYYAYYSVSPKVGNDCFQRCSDGPVRRVAGHPARAFVHGVSLPQPLMSWLGPVVGQKWPSGVFAPVLLALYAAPFPGTRAYFPRPFWPLHRLWKARRAE